MNDWKLINATLFNNAAYGISKLRVERGDKDNGEDPDPLQLDRSRFYMQLLGTQNARGEWRPRSNEELLKEEFKIIDKNLAEGRRVMFLNEEAAPRTPMGGGQIAIPSRAGYVMKAKPFKWAAPSEAVLPEVGNPLRRKGKLAGGLTAQPVVPRDEIYRLYEIVKAPVAKSRPAAATTRASR